MPSAAAVRLQIEQDLESRFPSALTPAPRTIREVATTGIDAADDLLDGGLPVGAISEIVGPASSGRTTLTLSFVARRTSEGRVCAWVDVSDALDPESAAANGVNLKQLLWVRCRDSVHHHLSAAQIGGQIVAEPVKIGRGPFACHSAEIVALHLSPGAWYQSAATSASATVNEKCPTAPIT